MKQVQGRWKIKSQNLVELNKQAMELKDKFVSFQINHVDRVQAYNKFLTYELSTKYMLLFRLVVMKNDEAIRTSWVYMMNRGFFYDLFLS